MDWSLFFSLMAFLVAFYAALSVANLERSQGDLLDKLLTRLRVASEEVHQDLLEKEDLKQQEKNMETWRGRMN